jgi:hypothetical protein
MARLILTEPGKDVVVGGNVTVIGTVAPGEVITVIRGNVMLDPSFNTGGNTVRLPTSPPTSPCGSRDRP